MPLESEAPYTCPSCAQTNYVGVGPGAGRKQRFTEDCPVCCRPILFTVEYKRDGEPIVASAELES
ncbi:MAG TPA: CPXCG motif-containing cysteine-rich protein [Candidatus Acidoferrales bacterium]|nr:CPXCG motif-containing cysteine-rich protein [Candidatus Acidoferrales bacterium]